MTDSLDLRIRCNTLEEAHRVVALLLDRNLPAASIRLQSSTPIRDPADTAAGKSRRLVFVVIGTLIGAVASCALIALTVVLFPLNVIVIAAVFTLAALAFREETVARRPQYAREVVESIENGEVHVLAQVSTQSESDQLRGACDFALRSGMDGRAGR